MATVIIIHRPALSDQTYIRVYARQNVLFFCTPIPILYIQVQWRRGNRDTGRIASRLKKKDQTTVNLVLVLATDTLNGQSVARRPLCIDEKRKRTTHNIQLQLFVIIIIIITISTTTRAHAVRSRENPTQERTHARTRQKNERHDDEHHRTVRSTAQ
jgi:hypothetical protein